MKHPLFPILKCQKVFDPNIIKYPPSKNKRAEEYPKTISQYINKFIVNKSGPSCRIYLSLNTDITSPSHFYSFNAFVYFTVLRSNKRFYTPPNPNDVPSRTVQSEPGIMGLTGNYSFRRLNANSVQIEVASDPKQIIGFVSEAISLIQGTTVIQPAQMFIMEQVDLFQCTPIDEEFHEETKDMFKTIIGDMGASPKTAEWRKTCADIILQQTLPLHMSLIYNPAFYNAVPPNKFIFTI